MTILDTWSLRPHVAGDRTPSEIDVAARKGAHTIGVIIPARNEASTIERVVHANCELIEHGVVDELLVVDDGSTDATSETAHEAGATVVTNEGRHGKGEALRCGVARSTADLVVFLDGDVVNFDPRFVTALVTPLLDSSSTRLVKAAYRRPLHGVANEGGRVTEILARPLLEYFWPELASIAQPLSGECAVRRSTLDAVGLENGYGVDIALLVDVARRFGHHTIVEVDLGERVHRNRPLAELRVHSRAVLRAVMDRALQTEGEVSHG